MGEKETPSCQRKAKATPYREAESRICGAKVTRGEARLSKGGGRGITSLLTTLSKGLSPAVRRSCARLSWPRLPSRTLP